VDDAPESALRARDATRAIGLVPATGVGVGAIVGGGVVVLAGAAFQHAGPAALLAFALNGVVALLTAFSYAELGTAFPESGGAYVFAKKILSVRAAFAVGWVLWFAYIVGAVLYALGFAEYASALVADVFRTAGSTPPAFLEGRRMLIGLALCALGAFTLALVRRPAGGGAFATVGKLVTFAVLIAAGLWAVGVRGGGSIRRDFVPFLPHGFSGVLSAMGTTFIAVQGFELVAGIGGEVKDPRRVIPRATFLSLALAMLVYLPFLFVIITAGTAPGTNIVELSSAHPDTVVAVAVGEYMGRFGYLLVMVAALLSTLSALEACLLAASRVALSMATDRTLPRLLAQRHATRDTPVLALYATLLAVVSILFMVPDLAAVGTAAGLIFLVSFALAHWTAYLARSRGAPAHAFRSPLFPLLPWAGGITCLLLAAYQAVTAPAAGAITAVWLGLGGMLYLAAFAKGAEIVDARSEARDPNLVRLRGRAPCVLVPVANPESAAGLVEVASALVPAEVGRVLLLNVMAKPSQVDKSPPPNLLRASEVLAEAVTRALGRGHSPEALLTIADSPWAEIERVSRARQCEAVLLGLTRLDDERTLSELERLLSKVDSDVAVLDAPPGFELTNVTRVLVPVGGRGRQHELRARLLGSLRRSGRRDVEFLQVLPESASDSEVALAERALLQLARDEAGGAPRVRVLRSGDGRGAVVEAARDADLLLLGLPRARGKAFFGEFALGVARSAPSATLLLSQGR